MPKRKKMQPDDKEYSTDEATAYVQITDKPLADWAKALGITPHKRGDQRYHWYYQSELDRIIQARHESVPLKHLPKRTLNNLAESLYHVQQTVALVEQQVEQLADAQQQMRADIARLQEQRGLPSAPPRGPRQIKAPEERLGPGQVVLRDFAELHGLEPGRSYQAMKNLRPAGTRAFLDQGQRTEWFYHYWGREHFRRCPACPAKEGQPHG